MSVLYLDTHAAVYLHAGIIEKFGEESKRGMEAADLLISPMVLLEFDYLYKRKRIAFPAREIFAALNSAFGVTICRLPFAAVTDEALNITWTNDPFDRLIVAAATVNRRAPLVTKDRTIRAEYAGAIW